MYNTAQVWPKITVMIAQHHVKFIGQFVIFSTQHKHFTMT